MNEGYIKLHRGMLNWGWYDDPNTLRVFIDILLNVQHKKVEYHGIILEAGQGIFGRKKMAKRLKISERSVRTALEHLKSTNEITIKSTNKYSIITVENWKKYQSKKEKTDQQIDHQIDQQPTNNRPTTDHIQECKNVRMKEIYNIISYLNEKADTKYKPESKQTVQYITKLINDGFTEQDVKLVIDKKTEEWIGSDFEKYLRPSTLFGSKFEGYLNAAQQKANAKVKSKEKINSQIANLENTINSLLEKIETADKEQRQEIKLQIEWNKEALKKAQLKLNEL